MQYLYLDFETPFDQTHNLRKMTLRRYLNWCKSHGGILGVAWAINDDEVQYHEGMPPGEMLDELRRLANDPTTCVVAHNAAFDIRVWRVILGLPQPEVVHCTLELAHAAWPNQPGAVRLDADPAPVGAVDPARSPAAYSLKSLAVTLRLSAGKMEMPPAHDTAAMAEYCKRDVMLCREIHQRALPRLCKLEIDTAEMCNRVRELHLDIQADKIGAALDGFDTAIATAAEDAAAVLGEAGASIFSRDKTTGAIRAVRTAQVRKTLLSELGFDTPTISAKKLAPSKLAEAPDAATVLRATGEANKAMSHRRRVSAFAGASEVDVELGYFRAHTGRFSSPSTGKGLNLHNVPKRNKILAKAIRSMFTLPDGYCWVRADLANVEYRINGWLAESAYIRDLFTKDILADPYSQFWTRATGQHCEKGMPQRAIAKEAVLGLGFLMGLMTWIGTLARALADPVNKLTVADFQKIADEQGWFLDKFGRSCQTKTGAPEAVCRVAQGTLEAFHRVHPEFKRFALWLEESVNALSCAHDPLAVLEAISSDPSAPYPHKLRLAWEDTPDLERSVRVVLADWPQPTVTWRDVGVRPVGFGTSSFCLSSRQSGSKGYRALTKNIMIENTAQACARNAMVRAQHQLRVAYPYQLTVHDELLLCVPCDRDSILQAKADLLRVLGPGNALGFDWAVTINPAEVNVSRSLYEVELGEEWWAKLAAGDTTVLTSLP